MAKLHREGLLIKRALAIFRFPLALAMVQAWATCPRTYGDVGIVLNESLDESMDRITGTGHTAVYFSNICADSPVKLRLCREGELGSVMSIYINIGEDQPFGWNVIPLSAYLYGVEDPRKRPLFATYKIKHLLEERYREKYLSEYCTTIACRTSPKAEWREMVAATLIRSVYIFAVDSTEEQDRVLIEEFNDSANRNHFNGITRNCADFVRNVINTYFPHAVSRDYLNDFGMTSPKAVVRTFTRYALRHPELNFRVVHSAQVPGTTKRSSEVRAGTEQLYRSKKLLVPMILFADHELPFVAASYLLTGRFSPQRIFEKYPAEEPGAAPAWADERMRLVGSSAEWKDYQKALNTTVKENKSLCDRHEMEHFFKHLDQRGVPTVDSDGSVWIDVDQDGEPLRVGVSANSVLAGGSNPQVAYKLLLARTAGVLKSPKHSRETKSEFKQDWANLQWASAKIYPISAGGCY